MKISTIVRGIMGGLLFSVASLNGAAAQRAVRPASTFRILEWNVSDSAWLKNDVASRAVLKHANPDILIWAQIHPAIEASDMKRLLSGLRGPEDTVWFISFRGTNGLEHTAVASRDSLRELSEFDNIPFPASAAIAQPPDNKQPGVRSRVPSTGVIARIGSHRVLIVGLHFTCCGDAETWREYRRRIEASELRKRIDAVLARLRVDGVVVAGDMNLVTGRYAMDTLLKPIRPARLGPMWRVEAYQADGWTDWTWDGRGTPFNGGRLDNVVYSAGTLRPAFARIWDTESLSADTLRANGLEATTSKSINRHRPVVVDFVFR